ncbi:hypothetical protein O9A_00115 [Bartonella koehlerae C-29]|uniref:Uncharacterized protein n=1 Tax=Bartonella koehlerae C-29 TaxID=1134510 RepID=A0A067WC12_9HYPH|nr:hypothetical protein O9A_00115 [Bartonella koehlerae C-29]
MFNKNIWTWVLYVLKNAFRLSSVYIWAGMYGLPVAVYVVSDAVMVSAESASGLYPEEAML